MKVAFGSGVSGLIFSLIRLKFCLPGVTLVPEMGEMNESHRRRSSKWDLKDAPEFAHDSMQESMPMPFHEKTRESAASVREHASGSRGSRKDDCLNKDGKRWEEHGNYSTRMSPGLDEWRHKSRGHSPRGGAWRKPTRSRSRSRSRSPPRGTKRDIGMNDRSRSKSGPLTQPCKEFASGRCAKGSRCSFNHDANQNYDHTRYPYDTRESSARGGKHSHHSSSDGYDRGRANEIVREREDDRGTRDSSFEHGERDPRRGRDIPCKFFAAGNCRNGKHCRFSHSAHTSSSSEGRLRDGRWGMNQDLDSTDPLKGSSRWKDTTLSGNVELDKGKHDIVVGQESMGTLSSRGASWDKNLDTRNERYGSPRNERDTKRTTQWKTESSDHATDVSKYKGTDEWMGDAMSPEWNPKVQSPNYMNKDEAYHIAPRSHPPTVNELTYLATSVKTLSREASGQLHHAVKTEILPNNFERSYTQHSDRMENVTSYNNVNFSDVLSRQDFNQSGANGMGLRSSSAVGHAQLALTAAAGGESLRNPPYHSAIQDERLMVKPDIVNANSLSAAAVPTAQSMVSEEQQVQLNNLSASLSQLLAGQQLPQLYASLNNSKALELLPNALALISPTVPTSILPNLSAGHQKPYDPLPVGVGHGETCTAHPASNISKDYVVHRTVQDEKREVHDGEQNGGETYTAVQLKEVVNHENQLKQSDSVANHPKKDSQILPNKKKTEDEIEETQEDTLVKDTEGEEKEDGGKKSKDLKVTRAFKFALVESVKELLKPTWKDGHINKDVYKNIVKKVADKVTGTLQVAHIPQTQEKIDQYLTSSKPKLTKLVQAYVERHQKSQK